MLSLVVSFLVVIELFCWTVPFLVSDVDIAIAGMLALSLAALAPLALAPLLKFAGQPTTDLVSPLPIVGLSLLMFGVVGSLLMLRDPSALLASDQNLRYVPDAALLLGLGFVAFAAGYLAVGKPAGVQAAPAWRADRLPLAIAMLVVVGWGVRFYAMSQGLVITKLISDPARDFLGNPLVVALFLRSHSFTLVAIAIAVIQAGAPRATRGWKVVAVGLVVLEVLYVVSVQLTRAPLVGVGMTVFCALYLTQRKIPFKLIGTMLVVFVVVITPFVQITKRIQNYGYNTSGGDLDQLQVFVTKVFPLTIETMLTEYPTDYFDSLGHSTHFSATDALAAIVEKRWESNVEPAGLAGLLAQFLGLVPRALWPSKPDMESTDLIQHHYGYGWYGRGYRYDIIMTPFTEAYAFLPLPAALVVMVLLGFGFRHFYRRLIEGSDARWATGVAIYSALSFEFFFQQYTIAGILAPLRDVVLLVIFMKLVLDAPARVSGTEAEADDVAGVTVKPAVAVEP